MEPMFLKKCLCGEKTKGAKVRLSLSTAYSLTHLKKTQSCTSHRTQFAVRKEIRRSCFVVFKNIHAQTMTPPPLSPTEYLSPVSDCTQRGRWWEAARCWKTPQDQRSPDGQKRSFLTICGTWSPPLCPQQPLAFLSISSSWTWWPFPRLTSPFSVYS